MGPTNFKYHDDDEALFCPEQEEDKPFPVLPTLSLCNYRLFYGGLDGHWGILMAKDVLL